MAINYITVDRARQQGGELLSVIENLRYYQDKLRQEKEKMENMTDGVTYTAIETQYGIQTGSNKGELVYNLVAGATAELASDTNLNQLLDWLVPTV
jgi:hypothetical protein